MGGFSGEAHYLSAEKRPRFSGLAACLAAGRKTLRAHSLTSAQPVNYHIIVLMGSVRLIAVCFTTNRTLPLKTGRCLLSDLNRYPEGTNFKSVVYTNSTKQASYYPLRELNPCFHRERVTSLPLDERDSNSSRGWGGAA